MGKRGVDYAPHEIDKALTTLAYYGGNASRASQELQIPERTLRDWRNLVHRERYQEIAEREGPALEALAASNARETILRASQTEHRIFDRLDAELDDLKPKDIKDLAGAAQHMATTKGINGTKLLELTGRPTQITEHREGADVLKELRQRVPWMFVDSTAQDISDSATTALPPLSAEETREELPAPQAAD